MNLLLCKNILTSRCLSDFRIQNWFPYNRYDRCNHWKKHSAIVAMKWRPHVSDRSDHSISQRLLKSGFHMTATIAPRFFQRSQRSELIKTNLFLNNCVTAAISQHEKQLRCRCVQKRSQKNCEFYRAVLLALSHLKLDASS